MFSKLLQTLTREMLNEIEISLLFLKKKIKELCFSSINNHLFILRSHRFNLSFYTALYFRPL